MIDMSRFAKFSNSHGVQKVEIVGVQIRSQPIRPGGFAESEDKRERDDWKNE